MIWDLYPALLPLTVGARFAQPLLEKYALLQRRGGKRKGGVGDWSYYVITFGAEGSFSRSRALQRGQTDLTPEVEVFFMLFERSL